MTFRKRTNQLLTASFDRTVNVYDLSPNTMGYVETLFGHQDKISSIDSLRADCAVSSGGRDKTARWWKIGEETQLVFRGGGRTKGLDALDDMMDEEDLQEERRRALNKEKEKTRFAEGSLECVVMVDDNTFLSGGDSGYVTHYMRAKRLTEHIKFKDQYVYGQRGRKSLSLPFLLHMVSRFWSHRQKAK